MKKVRVIALLIISLFIINMWSGVVYYSATGGKNLGKITNLIVTFSEFPQTIFKSLKDFNYHFVSQTYLLKDPNFGEVNNLSYDLFTLHSYWDDETNRWAFNLLNLRNDSLLYSWHLEEQSILMLDFDRPFRDLRPLHTLLTENKSLVINLPQSNNLIKIDSSSAVIWRNNELGYHHSMEFDADGHIWVCASNQGEYIRSDKWDYLKVKNLDRVEMTYTDDLIVKIDNKTGEILFKKSITEILVENNYSGLLFNTVDYREDPIHINDIQPALDSSAFWNKGDLFLSLRNLTSIVQYRPSTNKVIWLTQGPFLNQHDVDIISDKEISIFNNNMNWAWGSNYTEESNVEVSYTLKHNEIVTYDFEKKEFSKPFLEYFLNEKINTRSEGLSEFLSTGDVFVEEQNIGVIFVIGDQGVILRKRFNNSSQKWTHMTNWMRVYEDVPF